MSVTAKVLGALLWVGPAGTPSEFPDEGPPRSIEATRVETAPKIDGVDDDPIWARAPMGEGFLERTPQLGAEPAHRTRFQVAYDDDFLYVLIRADIPRDQIRVRTLLRDSFDIFGDSTVAVKIDPHHDRRSAMTLAVNADGAQIDWMVLEDGRVSIREWDAVWEAETKIRDDGFDAEFKIPFSILGMKGGEALTMGWEITRDEPTVNATYDWRVIVPPRHPVSASAFGELTGLRGVRSQRALEFTPFVVGSTDFEPVFRLDPRRRANVSAGADFRVQVGATSYIEASALTDFAQVEADQVQVVNDRFPLFFPERRPFFINGLDIFNFGRPQEAQLFFSRRIGLDGGIPAPILGGAKAYGRAGPVSYGVLNVQTLRQLPHDDEFEEDEGAAPENFTVGRVRLQTGPYASFGILAAGKHRFDEARDDAFSGGIDGELRAFRGKLRSYGFVATTWREIPRGAPVVDDTGRVSSLGTPRDEAVGSSAHALVEYQGLFVRPSISWLWSDEDFDAPMGFYRRPGTAQQRAEVVFAPRPGVLGLRDLQFGPAVDVTTTPNYDATLTRGMGAFFNANWNAGWSTGYSVGHLNDLVREDFELYALEVEADRYYGVDHSAYFSTPDRAYVAASTSYGFAQRFGGPRHSVSANLRIRANKHFSLEGTYSHLVGHLRDPEDQFNFGFLNGTVLFAVHRNLTLDTLVRYSMEPERERLGLQSRLRWRYRPGSDLFLVYRNDLPLGPGPADAPPRQNFHSLTLKLTFYLRVLLRR